MKDYELQRTANMLAFFVDDEWTERREVLLKLIQLTEKKSIVWALSCSGAMFFDGAWDECHDYDIIVQKDSLTAFLKVFEEMRGSLVEGQGEKAKYFASTYYASGVIGNVEFDIIVDYTVTTFNTIYTYSLEKNQIKRWRNIPIIPMEASMCLYGMMIGWQEKRRLKYNLCKEYLKQEGVLFPEILQDKNLPNFIKNDIVDL